MSLGRPLAVACLAGLFASGCATVVKRGRNEVLLKSASSDLHAFAAGTEVPLEVMAKGAPDGQARFTARVPASAQELTLQTGNQEFSAGLTRHVGVGWVVADVLLTAGIGLIVDSATGKWRDVNDVDVAAALSIAQREGKTRAPTLIAGAVAPPPEPVIQEAPKTGLVANVREQDSEPEAPPPPPRATSRSIFSSGKLAVLDFKSYAKDFKPEDVRYFSDLVRGATLRASPNLEVMTRENLLVLLQASGKDLGGCEGECEVDTGRRIGADAVVSGEVLKVGSRYKMSLKLHETKSGRLLSTSIASGKTIDDLDEGVQRAAEELFRPKR